MYLALSATGIDSGIILSRMEVDGSGRWTYESRAVEAARGTLREGDLTQLKSLYERVDWDHEVLNNPISADDRTLFRLEVDRGGGDRRIYKFSEAMNHLSWQFRDLVHFLRHNLAVAGEPIPVPPQHDIATATAHQSEG